MLGTTIILAVIAGALGAKNMSSGCGSSMNVYFCENFDTCVGTMMPHGWLNQDLLRGAYYNYVTNDQWRCDNPGGQDLSSPITAPAAIFDSDAISSTDNMPENVALVSPKFDTRNVDFTKAGIVLDWDQYFVEGYDSKIYVEVWNGAAWVEVYSETKTTFNPDHQILDITQYVMGKNGKGVESRIRFRWTGDASWFWIVDNVRVSKVDLVVTPNGCPSKKPFKCANDGMCVANADSCLLDNNCPANKPRRCLDGTCVSAGSDDAASCSDLVDCPASAPIRCADGSCKSSQLDCMTASNCPVEKPQRCNDGSCAVNVHECPLTLACPDEFNPFPCRGGSCAPSSELCPKTKATDLVCPCNKVQCLDLSCVDDYSQCQCPCEYPYLCVETRTCVQESVFCKDTKIPKPAVVEEKFGSYGAVRMVRVDNCPAGQFRCFDGTCESSLAKCPNVPCSAFQGTNGADLTYKCPDGSCAKNREDCEPIPACPANNQRCADGSCVGLFESCPAAEACSYDRKRCPDGRCYRECPTFDGCPIESPISCPNGQCAQNVEQCYADCPSGQHKCFDGDSCKPFSHSCPLPPSAHRAVPFNGNLECIAIREDAMFYDVVCVADRHFDDLFATVMVPAGIFEKQPEDAEIMAFDVPLSEVRPLPPYPDTISHVLGVMLPSTVFADHDFIRLTLRVDLPVGRTVNDYCLAQLVEYDDGEYEWVCKDNALVQDGVHFSGLVQNTDGVFIIMKKPGVCHKYRGFDDNQVEFILLGRVIPKTINSMKDLLQRLIKIRDRMPEIKRSDAVLTHISKATYAFSETCLGSDWVHQLESFPNQLASPNTTNTTIPPHPKPCNSTSS